MTNTHHCPHFVAVTTRWLASSEQPASTATTTTTIQATKKNDSWAAEEGVATPLWNQIQEVARRCGSAVKPLFLSDESVTPAAVVAVCDEMDALRSLQSSSHEASSVGEDGVGGGPTTTNDTIVAMATSASLWLLIKALEFQRYELLAKLMRQDYDAYIATASFLSPSRIPRRDLPNVQDVPFQLVASSSATIPQSMVTGTAAAVETDEKGVPLVPDCTLPDLQYQDSLLDQLLLSLFRKLVTQHTGGITSDQEGIAGLLEQGRTYMLQPKQTPEAQHRMVRSTLASLMTPVLPPFYRIFMAGIVPPVGSKWDGQQLGPWFYAPALTALVTPTFFGFLGGPSRPNRRRDGHAGGLVVEKCKFLQESGCKGLCLHQCKLPAQQFFQDELGLALTVEPNFVTQECQWSFGQVPVPVADDPTFPRGCLVGCTSRKTIAERMEGGPFRDLCN